MVKSYDWSCLENQLHQLQDLHLQDRGTSSATPPMDVTSIITQVARESEHHNISDNASKGTVSFRPIVFLIVILLLQKYSLNDCVKR